MIFFIYGSDTYRSHAYLHKMVDKFKSERDPGGYNTILLDCLSKDDAQKVMSEVLAAPFLAEKRMVVAKHLISSKETALKQALLERISLGSIPESTVLVIYEIEDKYKAKADTELFELLQKEKYKECFKPLTDSEISAWISKEITLRGCTVDRQALAYMGANCGKDTWGLHNIIAQLIAYAQSKTGVVTLEIAQTFIPELADDNIFNLVDAIVAGQKQKAFAMIRAQYNKGEDSGYIFSMILRQFKILLQIKDAQMRNVECDAKAMGLHPFVLKKTMPVVARYSYEQLRTAYEKLLDIDVQTKTGSGNQSLMLDLFVGTL